MMAGKVENSDFKMERRIMHKGNKKEDLTDIRKYFLLPAHLYKRADGVGNELGLNFSELLRRALEEFVNKVEKEKIDLEIADACKYYFETDQEIAEEWRNAEGKI